MAVEIVRPGLFLISERRQTKPRKPVPQRALLMNILVEMEMRLQKLEQIK